jgi:GMP reductase
MNMKLQNKKTLYYDNVALVPKYSSLESRKDANTSALLGGKQYKLPVIPSNMKCVIDEDRAEWLSQNDYMYVMHRFDINNFDFVKNANVKNWKNISISIGVKAEDYDLLNKIKSYGLRVDCITIDIAHGHSLLMQKMLNHVRDTFPDVSIIAGNVCTPEGFDDLCVWGADAVKVGIGPGAACTTKLKTGFTYPMYSCISYICEGSKEYSSKLLIADGGVSHNGDIAKAIHAGADFVMCGKLFSGCIDSPAPIDNLGHKLYYGSASVHNKNHKNNIEGTLIAVESNNMTYEQKLKEIEQDLQSSISYAGGTCVKDIRTVWWVEI